MFIEVSNLIDEATLEKIKNNKYKIWDHVPYKCPKVRTCMGLVINAPSIEVFPENVREAPPAKLIFQCKSVNKRNERCENCILNPKNGGVAYIF